MALSPYRAALLDPPQPSYAPSPPDRPRGPRRSHIAATVAKARHLVETTLMTHSDIGQRIGIPGRTV